MKVRVRRTLGSTFSSLIAAISCSLFLLVAGCGSVHPGTGGRGSIFANRHDRSKPDFHRGGSQLHADRDRDERHHRSGDRIGRQQLKHGSGDRRHPGLSSRLQPRPTPRKRQAPAALRPRPPPRP